jgi:uncharacterized repeat protein (TIGR01451 family)
MVYGAITTHWRIWSAISLSSRQKLWRAIALLLCCLCPISTAFAQTVNQYSVADAAPGGAITDLSCNLATSGQIVRSFVVPTNYTVRDVNLGILVNHTYRSDLRVFLTSPAGTVVNIMTWTGNVQGGDNLNDLFDDEATAAIGTHVAATNDPLTPVPPPYSHSFQPSNPLTAFDGQNANGTWTLRICDAVATDVGSFQRADLYITQPVLSVVKTSSVLNDGVSGSNPKAVPGAVVRYCVLITNTDSIAMTNITPSDVLPVGSTYVAGSMFSGTSCAAATTAEDDNNIGADESDPFGISISGSTITGSAATLAAGASFAMVFNVTIN